MFWKSKPQGLTTQSEPAKPPELHKSSADRFNEAASNLAVSLKAYSDAAWHASKENPNHELIEARAKVGAARKLVTEGRLAYALGRCIPEHVEHWPSWIQRDDFQKWVGFDAQDIAAREHEEADGSRKVKVIGIAFTFKNQRYQFVLRDRGMSYAPDSCDRLGDVEFWHADRLVAHFNVVKDLKNDFSHWEFSDVQALRVGPWMQDVLDIAAQIDAAQQRRLQQFFDDRTRAAAHNIHLG